MRMRILDRYVIREIVPPFLIALLVFTFILIIPNIINLAEAMIAKGVPWGMLLQLMAMLLPSVAVVVLGGTSLLGGRGFPVSTVVAAFFLNQLSQFALAVGVPFSAQTIIQALALGFGIGIYSVRWTRKAKRPSNPSNMEENGHEIPAT